MKSGAEKIKRLGKCPPKYTENQRGEWLLKRKAKEKKTVGTFKKCISSYWWSEVTQC